MSAMTATPISQPAGTGPLLACRVRLLAPQSTAVAQRPVREALTAWGDPAIAIGGAE